MKEKDYIIITNRVRISTALTLLRDVLPDDITKDEDISEVMRKLRRMEEISFSQIELEE